MAERYKCPDGGRCGQPDDCKMRGKCPFSGPREPGYQWYLLDTETGAMTPYPSATFTSEGA